MPWVRGAAWRFATTTLGAGLGAALVSFSTPAQPQELEHAMRQPWTLYVFVSSGMPHQALVGLAREAGRAHAAMVLRGFPGGLFDLQGEQRFIAQINAECCETASPTALSFATLNARAPVPAWSMDPALYHRFDVAVVPTFVLAATGATGEQSFSKVAGDMALANALKFFAQKSAIPPVRQQAVSIYQSTYGDRQ